MQILLTNLKGCHQKRGWYNRINPLPGSDPVVVRPYWYLNLQKDEIRCLGQTLLLDFSSPCSCLFPWTSRTSYATTNFYLMQHLNSVFLLCHYHTPSSSIIASVLHNPSSQQSSTLVLSLNRDSSSPAPDKSSLVPSHPRQYWPPLQKQMNIPFLLRKRPTTTTPLWLLSHHQTITFQSLVLTVANMFFVISYMKVLLMVMLCICF